MIFGSSIFLAAALAATPTNELDVARQALRDGFHALARTHAAAVPNEAGRLVVLESFAQEKKWQDLLKTLSGWGDPAGDAFVYYRALALLQTGDVEAAQNVFATGLPSDPVYRRLAARLLAERALADGQSAKAADYLEKISAPEPDDRMLLAEARSRMGADKDARKLWRDVIADTNAAVRLVATAAANLGDAATLRSVVSNTTPSEVRTFASLRLGRLLLRETTTFDEGAKMIRAVVSDSPDSEGASGALAALADGLLGREDWAGAAADYARVLETWPASAKDLSVQEGLGQALFKLGRTEEALSAFVRAEACATTDEDRAAVAVRAGDALAALGRPDDAMAKYRAILAKYPKTKTAELLKGIVRLREVEKKGRDLYGEFRFAEAQKCFAEVAAGDAARRGRMAFYEILCLYGQGRDEEAVKAARMLKDGSVADSDLRADVTLWLARVAYNRSDWQEADRLFRTYADSSGAQPEAVAEARVWAGRAALACNDYTGAIARVESVVAQPGATAIKAEAQVVQGEALIELARFDEAILVFDRAAAVPVVDAKTRLEAQTLKADALFALGADNPARYEEALDSYRSLARSENASSEDGLSFAYKIGMTLEKLKRRDEAVDQYYTGVVLTYRDARLKGARLGDRAKATFARAAFRLADICESRGNFVQALRTLELVATSDVPAAAEAQKRIDRIHLKGIMP